MWSRATRNEAEEISCRRGIDLAYRKIVKTETEDEHTSSILLRHPGSCGEAREEGGVKPGLP
jgi:hypothetical protein